MDPMLSILVPRKCSVILQKGSLKRQVLVAQVASLQTLLSFHHCHHALQRHHAFRQYRLSMGETSAYSVSRHALAPTCAFLLQRVRLALALQDHHGRWLCRGHQKSFLTNILSWSFG